MHALKPTLNPAQRYWRRVERRGDNECWPWKSYLKRNTGYGVVVRNRREWSAHRYGYFLAHGDIPADCDVDHTCRNRWCQNPAHLRLLSHSDHGRLSQRQRFVSPLAPANL